MTIPRVPGKYVKGSSVDTLIRLSVLYDSSETLAVRLNDLVLLDLISLSTSQSILSSKSSNTSKESKS